MSQKERKLLDKQGRFLQVVKDGRRREQVDWTDGRIIMSNRRIILASREGQRTIPLSDLDDVGGRFDVNQRIARVAEYTALRFGERGEQVVLLTSSSDPEEIEDYLYASLLDREHIYVRHPAVAGGVVQDIDWADGRVKVDVEEEAVDILRDDELISIELDDISEFTTAEQTVRGETRPVLKVGHTLDDGTSVQTHISGTDRHCSFLQSLFREGEQRSQIGVELDYSEQKVLMALHSGVSPFEIPNFVDMDVDTVEDIYDRLVELDVLDELRRRREVELTTRGRKVASGAMEQE